MSAHPYILWGALLCAVGLGRSSVAASAPAGAAGLSLAGHSAVPVSWVVRENIRNYWALTELPDIVDPDVQACVNGSLRRLGNDVVAVLSHQQPDGLFDDLDYVADGKPRSAAWLAHFANLRVLGQAYFTPGTQYDIPIASWSKAPTREALAHAVALGIEGFIGALPADWPQWVEEGEKSQKGDKTASDWYDSVNWSHWQSYIPQEMGVILNLFADSRNTELDTALPLLASVMDALVSDLPLDPEYSYCYAGEDRIWMGERLRNNALNHFYLAAARGDTHVMRQAARGIERGSVEAIPPYPFLGDTPNSQGHMQDLSFHYHGSQLYSGAYGSTSEEYRFAWYTRNLGDFTLDETTHATLEANLGTGQLWPTWQKFFDPAVIGRTVTRRGFAAAPDTALIAAALQRVEGGPIDPIIAAAAVAKADAVWTCTPGKDWTYPTIEMAAFAVQAWQSGVAPAMPLGHHHFEDSDYSVHRRPHFYASVKMLSRRIRAAERIGEEGKRSWHLSDGFVYVVTDARPDIYYQFSNAAGARLDVWPTIDWTELPGTTVGLRRSLPPFGEGYYAEGALAPPCQSNDDFPRHCSCADSDQNMACHRATRCKNAQGQACKKGQECTFDTWDTDLYPPLGHGSRQFVGGVSDGTYGVAAMDFANLPRNRYSPAKEDQAPTTRAKKSWFFFDDEIVALGSNVSSTEGLPVRTIVQQIPSDLSVGGADNFVHIGDAAGTRHCKGEFNTFLGAQGRDHCGYTPGKDEALARAPRWVAADDIAYYFPIQAGDIWVRRVTQRGSWGDIGQPMQHTAKGSNDDIVEVVEERSILNIAVDHGATPQGDKARYAYVVLPRASASAAQAYAANPPVEILRHDSAVHAVRQRQQGVLGAVFWDSEGGEVDMLEASGPSAVVMHQTPTHLRVAVSNPEHILASDPPSVLKLRIGERLTLQGLQGSSSNVKIETGASYTEITFTNALVLGRAKVLHFARSSAASITDAVAETADIDGQGAGCSGAPAAPTRLTAWLWGLAIVATAHRWSSRGARIKTSSIY